MGFDPCNFPLKIWESIGTLLPKWEFTWECRVHSFTVFCTLESMRCDSWASLLTFNLANSCFGREPKARVATFFTLKQGSVIGSPSLIVSNFQLSWISIAFFHRATHTLFVVHHGVKPFSQGHWISVLFHLKMDDPFVRIFCIHQMKRFSTLQNDLHLSLTCIKKR